MTRRRAPVTLPRIDAARCTGCGWCVAACTPHVLSLRAESGRKTAALHDIAGCTGCALCVPRCSFGAIRMAQADRPPLP